MINTMFSQPDIGSVVVVIDVLLYGIAESLYYFEAEHMTWSLGMKNRATVMVHFYRATVMHADVWRRRLDATTNWAIVTSLGIVTYAFSQPDHPAISMLVAIPFLITFLYMESRRYQMYDLWRYRVRMLNRYLVAPAFCVADEEGDLDKRDAQELAAMAYSLGTSIPRISIPQAMGYRIRRNYWLLFFAVLLMWAIKVFIHPTPARSMTDLMSHAHVWLIPGWLVLLSIMAFVVCISWLALRAPTEQMDNWIPLQTPLERLMRTEPGADEVSLLTIIPPSRLSEPPIDDPTDLPTDQSDLDSAHTPG